MTPAAQTSEPQTAAGRLFVAYEDANDEGAGNSLGHLLGIRHWTIRDVVLAIEAEAERRGYKHGYEAAKKEDPRSALRANAARVADDDLDDPGKVTV
jgi:hypothetical protein